jgi:hypothetical protein
MKPQFPKSLLMGLGLVVSLGFAQESSARYETCYEQEYVCHTEYQQSCGYEQQCHTVPGHEECRPVQVCTPRPSQQVCHTVTECGTNALGQPICKDREVCENTGGGGQDCGYVNECHNTGSTQQCNQQQVCDSRPHEVCNYQQVAKQCWVDDPPPYQPPQPPYQPPQPPYEPPYQPPQPPYEPPYQPPYEPPYEPPTPPYEPPVVPPTPVEPEEPSVMGASSVTAVELVISTVKGKAAVVTFKDKGQAVTYKTRYFITILDEAGVAIVTQFASGDNKVSQSITIDKALKANKDHTLVLRVVRTGGELVKDVSFIKTVVRPGN